MLRLSPKFLTRQFSPKPPSAVVNSVNLTTKSSKQVDTEEKAVKVGQQTSSSLPSRPSRSSYSGITVIEDPGRDWCSLMGVPEEHIYHRRVRIFVPSKNAMQSGTQNTHYWFLEFENRERWENPLMGWTSTGDPLSNLQLKFASREAAISFCEKLQYPYYVDEPPAETKLRRKSYADNFSWDRRTRVGSK